MRNLRVLVYLMVGILLGSIVGIMLVNMGHNMDKKRKAQTTTEQQVEQENATATEAESGTGSDAGTETDAATETETPEQTTIPEEQQPEKLVEDLHASLIRFDQLAEVGCRQLIDVKADGTTAEIHFYTCDENGLWSDSELTTTGYVGVNGVSRESEEGSKKTPAGAFPIGEAFYIEEQPDTGLESFRITEDTYWVDDPESELYNQKVELTGEKSWKSAEHMIEYPNAYKYGFVINYNMNPIEAGRGSAIFFHIGDNPTLGCIAVSEEMVLAYLKELDADMHPYILIQ